MGTKNEQQKSIDSGHKPTFDHTKENSSFDVDQHNKGNINNPEDIAYDKKRKYSKS